MSEDYIAEFDVGDYEVKDGDGNKNIRQMVNDGRCTIPKKLTERIILSLTKPSYVLGLGTGNIRTENCRRLERLLRKLVRKHNWKEASGVLSVLLKGTGKNSSPEQNRKKYWVAMELLKHIEGPDVNSTKMKHIYEIWMRKIGSMKTQSLEERFGVQVEYIIFCLQQGNLEEAHQAAICLMQEPEFAKDGTSNMVVGLTFYQLWYSTIPKEMQLGDLKGSNTPTQSDMSGTGYNDLVENSNASYGQNTDALCDSCTSVRIDKIISEGDISSPGKELSAEVDVSLEGEKIHQNFHQQSFYMNSADTENEEASCGDNVAHNSVFSAHAGLDPWVLPLQLPHSNRNVEDFIYLQREILNDSYKSAVKYLQLSLDSTPPVLAALSPLIQLLMIGDQVKEALYLLEKFCYAANTTLPFRLRARIMERFDRNNCSMISSCYEEILKNDPTCSYSLGRLVSMQQNGDYSTESLLEMIALHLDATYAECSTWKEFALCFLRLSQHEEDRMSVCFNGNEGGLKQSYSVRYNRIPKVFTEVQSAKSWSFRCKWWLRRHFGENMLLSDIAAGNLEHLTYKAACACHLYGHQFDGCLGCCTKPTPIIAVDEPSKGLKIQGRTVKKPSISEDFWSTSTCEIDNSAVQSQRSVSSISTSNQALLGHCSGTGSTSSHSEFTNHGLLLWNQTRLQWVGSKSDENRSQQIREPRLSWNATYENLLGTSRQFSRPVPLSEMVEFLVDIWEQEGMYD